MKECIIFIPVISAEQRKALVSLANKIWHECFTAILSPQQIDYMVEKFQSEKAIADQLNHQDYRYFLLSQNDSFVGYTGMKAENGKLFLSKLYLLQEERKKGYSNQVFDFLEQICKTENLSTIWLTVNRYNQRAISVYQKRGFAVVRKQVTDIGNGYVMDDFVMEKSLIQGM